MMINVDNLPFAFKLFTVLGCGLVAGVFFAFSTFVMSALARLQPREGIIAMQSINITAINPLFMIALYTKLGVREDVLHFDIAVTVSDDNT